MPYYEKVQVLPDWHWVCAANGGLRVTRLSRDFHLSLQLVRVPSASAARAHSSARVPDGSYRAKAPATGTGTG